MTTRLQHSYETEPLQVGFTLSVVNISDAAQAEALKKAREAYVMTLLAVGEISSGKAASLLGVSRLEMIDRMGQWGISLFDDSLELEDLQQEIDQAIATLDKHSA
jgi:predicted HTH domain antitoxin